MLKIIGNMKKRFIIFVGLILMGAIFLLSACGFFSSEEHIATSTSPNKIHTVEAYRLNGGATTAYSINVYLTDNNKKKLIYTKYREYKADINWIDDNIVTINEIMLDLSKNEVYNWRDDID